MTWRELINEINKYPDLLDEPAFVWAPMYRETDDEFPEVSGIDAYYPDKPADRWNYLSINLKNW